TAQLSRARTFTGLTFPTTPSSKASLPDGAGSPRRFSTTHLCDGVSSRRLDFSRPRRAPPLPAALVESPPHEGLTRTRTRDWRGSRLPSARPRPHPASRRRPCAAPRGHGSQNLVLHEAAHGLDATTTPARSASPAFNDARNADASNLTPYESQPGVAGQQESYAESAARHFGGDPDANTRYPHLGEYWASQWGLAWNLNTSERHTWTLPATSPSTCGRSTKAELSALLGSSTRPVILSTTTYSVTSAASCQASKNSSLLGRTKHPEPLL